MFAEWLRGDTNPTYEKLVTALARVGKRKLQAESVCRNQGKLHRANYHPLLFDLHTCLIIGISPSVLDATDTVMLHQSHDMLNKG